jgi:hypothetical protein
MARGKSEKTKEIISAAYAYLEENHPATVRGCCYKLFTLGLIDDMSKKSTNSVGRILTIAREDRTIPWKWVVDETRSLEQAAAWTDLKSFGLDVLKAYRKDRWQHQPNHVEVWSEKGTIRGVLAPVLDEFAIGFRVMHGYGSTTAINDVADMSGRVTKPFIVLCVGDWDPSGLHMSMVDLPDRTERYGGEVAINRIALIQSDLSRLPYFDAETKRGDPRYNWFTSNFGEHCWELDAMPPNILRSRVHEEILSLLDVDAWDQMQMVEDAERASIEKIDW